MGLGVPPHGVRWDRSIKFQGQTLRGTNFALGCDAGLRSAIRRGERLLRERLRGLRSARGSPAGGSRTNDGMHAIVVNARRTCRLRVPEVRSPARPVATCVPMHRRDTERNRGLHMPQTSIRLPSNSSVRRNTFSSHGFSSRPKITKWPASAPHRSM